MQKKKQMWIILLEPTQKETNRGKYIENKMKRVLVTGR